MQISIALSEVYLFFIEVTFLSFAMDIIKWLVSVLFSKGEFNKIKYHSQGQSNTQKLEAQFKFWNHYEKFKSYLLKWTVNLLL